MESLVIDQNLSYLPRFFFYLLIVFTTLLLVKQINIKFKHKHSAFVKQIAKCLCLISFHFFFTRLHNKSHVITGNMVLAETIFISLLLLLLYLLMLKAVMLSCLYSGSDLYDTR
uniref:Uncharacterized protein n=1 Tax=Cacopsylla melanoneura TaxID=428564 RepID=A0A8D9BEA0_9HEMI